MLFNLYHPVSSLQFHNEYEDDKNRLQGKILDVIAYYGWINLNLEWAKVSEPNYKIVMYYLPSKIKFQSNCNISI